MVVKIAKKLIAKVTADNSDLQLTILDWQNTPTVGLQTSPTQKLHSRRTRTLLPTAESLLLPAVVNNDAVVEDIQLRRSKAKYYHDRQAKSLPELQIGKPVELGQKGGTWKRALTVDKLGDRSFLIQTNDGAIYQRNRKFIRAVSESTEEQDSSSSNQTTTIPPSVQETPKEGESTELSSPKKEQQELTANSPVKHTASGRIVKEPTRYKDCVRH